MELPSLKYIFIIVVFNVLMISLSFGLQSYFGGGAFVTSDIDADTELTLPEFPDLSFTGVLDSIDSVLGAFGYIIDSIGLLLSVLTFDITGIPTMLRFLIAVPLFVVNLYLLLSIVLSLASIVAELVPF